MVPRKAISRRLDGGRRTAVNARGYSWQRGRDGAGFDGEGEGLHQTCHSTKRTHRFSCENSHLTDWITISYAAEERGFLVGSFRENEPTGEGISVGLAPGGMNA